jgi:hypothetical protein
MVDPARTPSGIKSTLMDLKLEPDLDQMICRPDKLSQTVADNISSESSKIIDGLVEQVNGLNPVERLLLYLKLPTKSQGNDVDPLRQPLNPLGSRAEITFTINWIKTHLEEDPQISLPKHEVYDEYLSYCSSNSVKPLSTADFGKVMKQVYPQVRPRRLGTRGNSKYCYAGLRKRSLLEPPATPDISLEGGRGGEGRDAEEELGSAASFLIREWVEKILGVKFENLTELALHLLDKMYVDNRSSSACTLLTSNHRPTVPPVSASLPPLTAGGVIGSMHSDGGVAVVVSSNMNSVLPGIGLVSSIATSVVGSTSCLPGVGQGLPGQINSGIPSQGGYGGIVHTNVPVSISGLQDSLDTKLPSLHRTSMDSKRKWGCLTTNLEAQPINGKRTKSEPLETKFHQEVDLVGSMFGDVSGDQASLVGRTDNKPPPGPPQFTRIQLTANRQPIPTTSSISLDKLPRKKQTVVQVTNNIMVSNFKTENNVEHLPEEWISGMQAESSNLKTEYDEPADLTTHQLYLGEPGTEPARLKVTGGSGGSSSDAQEEEIAGYFPGAISGDPELDNTTDHKKLTQLREYLHKNLKSPSGGNPLGGGAFKPTSLPLREINKGGAVGVINSANPTLSNRRRVSFNPITVTDPAVSTPSSSCPSAVVPPSPHRRRHYSFQPISPKGGGPLQSPPASPFVSPSSTPVNVFRSRHSSGSALPIHLLPGGGGRNHHPSGCSDVSRAATYGSASESSTPFISPQSTPIPFNNRSRHNSAQPRLCRSRHSSGLTINPQYSNRFNTNPYSPGALSNLNNPFSPQPATPVQCSDQEPIFSQVQNTGQYQSINVGGNGVHHQDQDPRSRHSSAGSEPGVGHLHLQAPRSAPMSPYSTASNQLANSVRVRHQSAGGAIQQISGGSTIHYRPTWNGGEFNGDDLYNSMCGATTEHMTTTTLDQSQIMDYQVW